jgi:hypothetical protein
MEITRTRQVFTLDELSPAARDECEHATSEEYVVLVEQERDGHRRRFDADGRIAPYEWWGDEVPA